MKSHHVLIAGFLLLAGCSSGGSSDAQTKNSVANTSSPQPAGLDRCALLNDAELQEVIGPHDSGKVDLGNMWGLQSCRWTSTTAQKIDGFPEWHDAVEVAVFDKDKEPWARGEAKGEPVSGFVEGAVYDTSYGDLWFKCGNGRFCVVKVRTASGDNRQQHARRLSEFVDKRVR